MRYTKNLITNGEASSLQGWAGSGELERETFKIKAGCSLEQTISLNSKAGVCILSFECLPEYDSGEQTLGNDVTLNLMFAHDRIVTVILPA